MHEVRDSNQLFIDAWRTLVPRLPSGSIGQDAGVVATLGNVELPFLNTCFHTDPIADAGVLCAAITTARGLAAGCPHPWFYVLCEDWAPAGWEQTIDEEGLAVQLVITGMTARRLAPPRRPLPELELRRVSDEDTARDLAELNAHAYQIPLSMVECICNTHLWREDAHGYVGYHEGAPVSCSAVFPVNETRYVGFVATHPDHGCKGYAEAVMRHSIEKAGEASGHPEITLHATEAGRPLYAAMGFRDVGRFQLLSKPHERE
jgi:GNAT superfamily N-acetyltransferase